MSETWIAICTVAGFLIGFGLIFLCAYVGIEQPRWWNRSKEIDNLRDSVKDTRSEIWDLQSQIEDVREYLNVHYPTEVKKLVKRRKK